MDQPAVVLLHGWPGLASDYDEVVSRLPDARCIVPALTGFGTGFDGPLAAGAASADRHAARLLPTIPVSSPAVVVGYDIGSRIAQAMLRQAPDRFAGAVLTPGYPGIGARAGAPELADRFWYQHFHRSGLASRLIDGSPDAVRTYLEGIVESWAPGAELIHGERFDRVVRAYSRPGAFEASLAWYRDNIGYSGTGVIHTPTTMLWPERDPLFPLQWADELTAWFTDITLQSVDTGHFVPLEDPASVADAITRHLDS
ncbi:alpha/beta fold hydrolase [Microbacterium sp. RG1]|uniref:alpha/beta fold hydrolase n=1 Tax=Microbacterium sp. RG1 TaxID=2489212 RepID=UPI0010CA4D59|nr:alpha/beta hydrolase [Microbacterium sp. RG1]QCQ17173.1 alpha/beta hydrolase [Microbacterium sp. RG1]